MSKPTRLLGLFSKKKNRTGSGLKRSRIPWMRLTRRFHMYLGLFLLPFVILYGATGFLFNHSSAFSARETRILGPSELDPKGEWNQPHPELLAIQTIRALRDSESLDEETKNAFAFDLSSIKNAQISGTVLLEGTKENESGPSFRHRYSVDWNHPEFMAKLYASPIRERAEKAPFAVEEDLELDVDFLEQTRIAIQGQLASSEEELKGLRVRRGPTLEFDIDTQDETWHVAYGFREQSLSATPVHQQQTLSLRNFLTRLHVSHGYPVSSNVRTIWGLIVDVMSAAMVIWGLSGILMWWQIKRTRGLGLYVVLASLLFSGAVGFAMYQMF